METLKSFLIIIVVVLSFGVAVIAGQNGLLSARCAARCLTEHKASPREGRDRNDHRKFKMLDRCRRNKQCSECLKPCDAGEKQVLQENCDSFCETSVCRRSCRFLIFIHTYKSGDCPEAETATGFEAACLAACSIDGDCTDNRKCCPNMCGYACRAPVYTGLALPGIPFNLTMEERRKGRSLRLNWVSPDTGGNRPYGVQLYLLEQRNTTNQKATWNRNTPWETVSMSVSRNVFIRQVHAGHWYQYRIAAVNETGTQGYSPFSKPFKSSRGIQRPLPPQNITEGGVTTLHRGQVDVTIHWQPPRYSDLPIWKYQLTWSERLTRISPVLVRIPVFEKMVPGHVLEFKLKRLKPGTTYHIQIEAIVQRGNRQLRSNKASKILTTCSPHTPNPANVPKKVYISDIIKVEKLRVVDGISYFDKGSLKAALSWKIGKDVKQIVKSYMIYWLPQSCDQEYAEARPYSATSDVTRFEVYDLQYECQYVIKVHAVTQAGQQGRPSTVKLSTPTCQEILVKGSSLPPECPKREDQVPRSPRRVEANIIKNNCTVDINITWRHPRSDLPIESYIIHYKMAEDPKEGEKKEENTDETVPKQTPVEINLDKVKSRMIAGLKPAEKYMIRLFAVSSAGVGVPAFINILTPLILPCGSDKDPEPPDTVTVQNTTVTIPTVFHSPEVSTDVEGVTVTVSKTTPVSSNCTTAYTEHQQYAGGPNLNIYKTVYYMLFFIHKLLTRS